MAYTGPEFEYGEVYEALPPELRNIAFEYSKTTIYDVFERALDYMLPREPGKITLTIEIRELHGAQYRRYNWLITKIQDIVCKKCGGSKNCFSLKSSLEFTQTSMCKEEIIKFFVDKNIISIYLRQEDKFDLIVSAGYLYHNGLNALETGKFVDPRGKKGKLPRGF